MIYRSEYVLPIDGCVITHGEVLVREGRIAAVGSNLSKVYVDEPLTDLGKCALLPGFVNTHCHLDYTFTRNAFDGKNLWEWIESAAFNRARRPDIEVVRLSAILGAGELILTGVTCIADSSFTGAAVDAIEEVGQRGIVYLEIFGQSLGTDRARFIDEKLADVLELGNTCSSRIRIGISPHSVYSSDRETLELCAQRCVSAGIPVAIHASETWAEAEYLISGTGPVAELRRRMGYEPMVAGVRPISYLAQVGLLRAGVCLAHCVDLCEEEVELVACSGVGVAHCPGSNAFLGCGIAPVSELAKRGARVGIGTDSAGTRIRFDFFEEMRLALALQRVRTRDASSVSARDTVEWATRGGAEALGMGNLVGTLEPGKFADLIAVDLADVLPSEDIWLAVLSRCREDVRLVVIDGVELVRDGKLLGLSLSEVRRELEERLSIE
ncbi:MAG: amidohydrolase family protein [Armatimonadota bacterium]